MKAVFYKKKIPKSMDVKIEELNPPTSVISQQGMLSGSRVCPHPRPVAFHGRDDVSDTKHTTSRDNAMQPGNISTFWMNTSVYGTKFRCQTPLFMMSIHEN